MMLLILVAFCQHSCRKFVQVGTPPNNITQENIYSNDRTATSVLTGLCSRVGRVLSADMAKYGGLLADEWTLWSGSINDHILFYSNSLNGDPRLTVTTGREIWNSYYNLIFRCNAAIEGVSSSTSLSPHVKKQLLGEAYFMRAWLYLYLTNLYGDLPLPVGTDPEINRLLLRSSKQTVYELIIADLLRAQEDLSADYVNGQLLPYTSNVERTRPTKWAAAALLARAYLYAGQYEMAEIESSRVIAHASLFSLSPLVDIFLKNSSEAIWQSQPQDIGWNTFDARMFHLKASPAGLSGNKPVHLSPFVLSAFEPGDKRRIQWVDSLVDGSGTYHFPVKYKVGEQNASVNSLATLTEYSMVLRLGEQYLIRAEAMAKQNKLVDAIADLDILRSRGNLPLIANTNPGISQENLLNAILHERQVELFTEWGHRWFDLKRFGKVDEVMSIVTPVKGGSWETTDQLLPIPSDDILRNPNLTQNSGY